MLKINTYIINGRVKKNHHYNCFFCKKYCTPFKKGLLEPCSVKLLTFNIVVSPKMCHINIS